VDKYIKINWGWWQRASWQKKQSQPSNKKVFDIAGAGRLLTAFCF
jgi:hypothetical protein